MHVLAFSTLARPEWRWRIGPHEGARESRSGRAQRCPVRTLTLGEALAVQWADLAMRARLPRTTMLRFAHGEGTITSKPTITRERKGRGRESGEQGGKTPVTTQARVVKWTAEAAPYLEGMEAGWTESLERFEAFVAKA